MNDLKQLPTYVTLCQTYHPIIHVAPILDCPFYPTNDHRSIRCYYCTTSLCTPTRPVLSSAFTLPSIATEWKGSDERKKREKPGCQESITL